ncbi:MAG: hypothetical protein AB7N31_10675 [Pyrinomonadaceae bacterium]
MSAFTTAFSIRTKLDMICASKFCRNVFQDLIGIEMKFDKRDPALSVIVFRSVVRSVCYDNLDNSVHTAIFIK